MRGRVCQLRIMVGQESRQYKSRREPHMRHECVIEGRKASQVYRNSPTVRYQRLRSQSEIYIGLFLFWEVFRTFSLLGFDLVILHQSVFFNGYIFMYNLLASPILCYVGNPQILSTIRFMMEIKLYRSHGNCRMLICIYLAFFIFA